MGKINKLKKDPIKHTNTLAEDILSVTTAKSSTRVKARYRKQDEEDPKMMGASQSKKILNLARKQQQELIQNVAADEEPPAEVVTEDDRLEEPSDTEYSISQEISTLVENSDFKPLDLDEEEMRAVEMFEGTGPTKTAADKLAKNISEQELSLQLVKHYRIVGEALSGWRSGKLPKGLTYVPTYGKWQQLMNIMEPDRWTAAAMFQVAKIHVAKLKDGSLNLKEFLEFYLLPRVRDDIAEYKRLNYFLYAAIVRCATYKPISFYTSIIFPLIKSGNCTVREGRIIEKILSNHKIHDDTSLSAIANIARLPYSPIASWFLRTLLAKRYAMKGMPFKAVVQHFTRETENRQQKFLVIWHQCLLTFCQEYGTYLDSEQKDALKALVAVHNHHDISPIVLNLLK